MKINKELEARCIKYDTTLHSCKCDGFFYRKYCKHNTYLNDKNIKYEKSEYFIGVFFEYEDKKYNVFLVHHTRFDAWIFATKIMRSIYKKGLMNRYCCDNKIVRIRLFENLKVLYRNFE